MNTHPTDRDMLDAEARFDAALRDRHAAALAQLSPQVRAQLAQRRGAALRGQPPGPRQHRLRFAVAGFAALCALALGVRLYPQRSPLAARRRARTGAACKRPRRQPAAGRGPRFLCLAGFGGCPPAGDGVSHAPPHRPPVPARHACAGARRCTGAGRRRPAATPLPAWDQLTPAQRELLIAPVRDRWNREPEKRARFMAYAERWKSMPPPQRERARHGMQRWEGMTPEQREQARAPVPRGARPGQGRAPRLHARSGGR